MAVTGKGDFPLQSSWAIRRRTSAASPYVKVPFASDKDTSEVTIFNDWMFNAGSSAISGSSVQTLPTVTGTATGSALVDANGLPEYFTDTNGVTLQTHSAKWVQLAHATGSTEIQSNQAAGRASVNSYYYYDTTPNSADYRVGMTLTVGTLPGGGTEWAGVMVRQATGANTAYFGQLHYNGSNWVVEIYRLVGGTATQLGSTVTVTVSLSTPYFIEMEAVGTTITLYFDGVQRIQVTDGNITAAGKPGLFFENSGAGALTRSRGDGFFATNQQVSGGAITGTSTQTLSAPTGTATGQVLITGNSSATLTGVTGSATGQVRISGSSDATLPAVTGTANGNVIVSGTSVATLADVGGTATGTVGNGAITGTSSATLDAVTGTAEGDVIASGTSAQTLTVVTGTAEGDVIVSGSSSQTLSAVGGTATGTVGNATITGTSVQTLENVSGTATGTVTGGQPVVPSGGGGSGGGGWKRDEWEERRKVYTIIDKAFEPANPEPAPVTATETASPSPETVAIIAKALEVKPKVLTLKPKKAVKVEEEDDLFDDDGLYAILLLAS